MSEARRARRALERMNRKTAEAASSSPAAKVLPLWTAGIFLGVMVMGLGAALWIAKDKEPPKAIAPADITYTDGNEPLLTEGHVAEVSAKEPANVDNTSPKSFDAMVRLAPEEIADVDIARLNLLCAEGLPGACADLNESLRTLDQWSEAVRVETDRHMYRFRQNPQAFKSSEGYFRMLLLITVLQQDFHVDYNPARDESPENPQPQHVFFANSPDLFIHGLLDTRLGTCSSMPVLYVAVGRRLGYPLKLVAAKSHLFVRWDAGDGASFNIEGTNRGLACHDDDYYKKWPRPMSEADLAGGQYLKSMNPAEEVAAFLQIRGICLQVNGRYGEAKAAFDRAVELVPSSELYARFANQELLTSKEQP